MTKEYIMEYHTVDKDKIEFIFKKSTNFSSFGNGEIGLNETVIPKSAFDAYKRYCNKNKEKMPDYDTIIRWGMGEEDWPYSFIPYMNPEEEDDDEFPSKWKKRRFSANGFYINNKNRQIILEEKVDVLIPFVYWWNEHGTRKIQIVMKYENISWFFHDLFHAEHHVDDNLNIIISQYCEYDAIIHSIEECIRLDIPLEYQEFEELTQTFNSRFRTSLGHNFMHLVDEQYAKLYPPDDDDEDEE